MLINSFLNCSVGSSSTSKFFATVRHRFAETKYFLDKLSVLESSLKRLSVRCSFPAGNWLVMDSSAGSLFAARYFIMMMMKIEVKSFRKHSNFAFLTLTWKWKIVSEREKTFAESWKMTSRREKINSRQMIWDFHYWVQVGSGRQKELNRQQAWRRWLWPNHNENRILRCLC